MKVLLTDNQFNPNGYWSVPIEKILFEPTFEDVALFDQNGFDLTELEKHYAYSNRHKSKKHREHRSALKEDWFTQDLEVEGSVLNHSLLFERKAYTGDALKELNYWSKKLPLIHKIISLRPKWGLDFSMDYVDREGNCFEILHWEWDSFNYEEINNIKIIIEEKLLTIDWQDAGIQILKNKDQWHNLDFFAQSDWKCNYFGIPKERFKMVSWK
jgi:hypothetical protein